LGELKLTITEATIAEVTELPSTREKYFKGIIINRSLYKKKLKPEHLDPDWKKGISRSWIKEEYWTMFVYLHKFLTCEARYVIKFLYHLRVLLHFEGGPQIKFPHFIQG
jgi:hypothetical protein